MSAPTPSILNRVGGTLLAGFIIVVSGTVAAGLATLLSDSNILFATALTWVLASPVLLFAFPRVLGLDPETIGVRPSGEGARRPLYLLGVLAGLACVLLPALIGRVAGGYLPMPPEAVAALDVPSGSSALPAVVFALPALMLAAFGEELLFRGVLLRLWQPLLGARGALVLSSLFFVAVHTGNPGAAPRGAVGVFLAGIALGAFYLRGGGLWAVAGAHLGWNAGEALLIGVPVSGITLPSLGRWQVMDSELWRGLLGGSFGPEEGLLFHGALGLAAGVAVVFAAAAGVFARNTE